jgi:hypothetical protein
LAGASICAALADTINNAFRLARLLIRPVPFYRSMSDRFIVIHQTRVRVRLTHDEADHESAMSLATGADIVGSSRNQPME